MSTGDSKDIYREMVTTVQRKLAALPESSALRSAFSTSILDEAVLRIEQSDAADLEHGPWAPAFSVNWISLAFSACLCRRSFLEALRTLPLLVYLFLMAVSPFLVESGPSYTART
jgi:hypothetical protein